MPAVVALRLATLQDAKLLLAWRNDPQTRSASHDCREITLAEHLAWLNQLMGDSSRRLLIAEQGGVPVGSVRADKAIDGATELSWTVAPDARGRGIGRRMLAALLEELSGPVRAEVKIGNVASARIAESVGLCLIREDGGVLHYVGTAPS
jgi:RimJ/RimL family protein N-acetyltransferase